MLVDAGGLLSTMLKQRAWPTTRWLSGDPDMPAGTAAELLLAEYKLVRATRDVFVRMNAGSRFLQEER